MSQQPFEIRIPDLSQRNPFMGFAGHCAYLWLDFFDLHGGSGVRGVYWRFGKARPDKVKPGLHFKLPFGIDEVYALPVERQLKQEYGFATEGGTNSNQFTDRRGRDRKEYGYGRLERARWNGSSNTASMIPSSICSRFMIRKEL